MHKICGTPGAGGKRHGDVVLLNRLRSKINLKLLLIQLAGIVVMAAVLTTLSVTMIQSAFQRRYEDKLQTPSRIFLAQYSYKDIVPYIDLLHTRYNLNDDSAHFLEDRRLVLDMELSHAGEAFPHEFYDARHRMIAYAELLAEFKDDKYFRSCGGC